MIGTQFRRAALFALPMVIGLSLPAYAAPEDSESSAPASDAAQQTTQTTQAPPPYCQQSPTASPTIEEAPWTVPMYSAADRLAPYSTGAGVTVAVLDTGVQADHPQLSGNVETGFDFVNSQGGANNDCSGHGTGMAGIVAGKSVEGVGFVGLAPDTSILPVRVTEQAVRAQANPEDLSTSIVASAINWAVSNGADVVVLGVTFYGAGGDDLQAAVNAAIAAGVVVIAGAGDLQPDGDIAYLPAPAEVVPYPAEYDGVIGVGSVGQDRVRDPKSEIGDFVDLVAPGSSLTVPSISGQAVDAGTAYAAAYAAAAAALVLGANPPVIDSSLTGAARVQAVTDRIVSTASPSPGDGITMGYGAGVLDPYRALTEMMSSEQPIPPSSYEAPPPDPAADSAAQKESAMASRGSIITWSSLGALLVIGAGAFVWVRGRSGSWKPATVRTGDQTLPEAEPEFESGEKLFAPKELD